MSRQNGMALYRIVVETFNSRKKMSASWGKSQEITKVIDSLLGSLMSAHNVSVNHLRVVETFQQKQNMSLEVALEEKSEDH